MGGKKSWKLKGSLTRLPRSLSFYNLMFSSWRGAIDFITENNFDSKAMSIHIFRSSSPDYVCSFKIIIVERIKFCVNILNGNAFRVVRKRRRRRRKITAWKPFIIPNCFVWWPVWVLCVTNQMLVDCISILEMNFFLSSFCLHLGWYVLVFNPFSLALSPKFRSAIVLRWFPC